MLTAVAAVVSMPDSPAHADAAAVVMGVLERVRAFGSDATTLIFQMLLMRSVGLRTAVQMMDQMRMLRRWLRKLVLLACVAPCCA